MNVGALRQKGVTLHMMVIATNFIFVYLSTVLWLSFILKENQYLMLQLFILFVPRRLISIELLMIVESR